MTSVNVVSPASDETTTVELPDAIFAAKINVPLMHQVVVAQRAAARQGKRRRTRTGWGKRADTKRAIVTLADGDRIDIFGGPVS